MFIPNDHRYRLNLQLFAQAGDSINTTTGTVNAYTGAATTSDAMSSTMKTYYDTALLENSREDMIFMQFADPVPLPANHGMQIEFRKWNTFDRAEKLKEGVIPNAQGFGQTKITAGIFQTGTYTAVSDVLDKRAVDPVILGATEEMGASMSETQEVLMRDALMTNPNVLYADNVDLTTWKVTGAKPTSCAELKATDAVCAIVTPRLLSRLYTHMRTNKVPFLGKGGAKYAFVTHPHIIDDLRNHPDWVEYHKHTNPDPIFKGEVGELHGFRIIDHTLCPIANDEDYTSADGTPTYHSFAFGKGAFSCIEPGEGNFRMIVKDAAEIGGPLEQFSTIGYKGECGHIVKYTERVTRVVSTSTLAADAEVNY